MTGAFRIVGAGSLACFLLAGSVAVAQDVKLRPLRPVYIDSLGTAINAPEGVAYDGSSRLVVADTGNRRLVLFDVTEESVSASAEFRLSEVPAPVRVRFDSAGNILALDGKSHRVARVGADGTFKAYVEIKPASGQKAVFIKSFDVDDEDNLYLLDTAGARVVVVDKVGDLRRTVAFGPEIRFLSDLTVNSVGTIFAIDSTGRNVFVARKSFDVFAPLIESMREDLDFPTAITVDRAGFLYISDTGGNTIAVFGENGSFQGRHSNRGRTQGFLWQPAGLATDGNLLFVADRGNNRVQVFEIVR